MNFIFGRLQYSDAISGRIAECRHTGIVKKSHRIEEFAPIFNIDMYTLMYRLNIGYNYIDIYIFKS